MRKEKKYRVEKQFTDFTIVYIQGAVISERDYNMLEVEHRRFCSLVRETEDEQKTEPPKK